MIDLLPLTNSKIKTFIDISGLHYQKKQVSELLPSEYFKIHYEDIFYKYLGSPLREFEIDLKKGTKTMLPEYTHYKYYMDDSCLYSLVAGIISKEQFVYVEVKPY